MTDLPGGIRRLTFPLPLGIDHVHCYLLPGSDGWTLVDTGLGLPDAAERWEPVLAELDAPVVRIVVTHFHPDHAGGGEDAQALTGARAYQGARDYEQCEGVWGRADWSERLADYLGAHGLPEPLADELRQESRLFAPFIRFARDPERLHEGDEVDGWRVLELPGHADGHICLLRDGVLVAGDHLLQQDHADGRPLPGLAARPARRLPRLARANDRARAAPGASRATTTPSTTRSRARARSSSTTGGGSTRPSPRSAPEPRSAYEVSLALFGAALDASGRRFALAETLAHLERLVLEGRAARGGDDTGVSYTAT